MKKYLGLFLILLLASFLRFWQLGINPPSLAWDEVSWGYNAYSLGKDGRDEFGKFLPIQYLESFGDFKPPVYAYLDIFPVKIFGLNEFAVRFPSAFFGVLTVLVTYFLTKRIFPDLKPLEISKASLLQMQNVRNLELDIPIIATAMLAISPWHINLSRAAFEANVATFFIVAGVWLFLGGIAQRKWYLGLSVASFILSMYTFNTARVVAPLLIMILAIAFRKELLERKKNTLIAIIVGIILITPLAGFLFSPQAQLRFHEVNFFSDPSIVERTNQEITNDQGWLAPRSLGEVGSKILHNRRVAFSLEYLKHYFDHFNPSFLFIKGDGNPKFSTQDVGQFFIWELPFLVAGVLFLFKRRQGFWWLVPLWLVIGIIPAGTARETPHALRIETTLPTFQILVAVGVAEFIACVKRLRVANNFKFLVVIFTFSFLLFNFMYYFHGYWTHYPREFSGEWQYGYKEAINYIKEVESGYDKIVVTEVLGRPYIYTLFYTKGNPTTFRETAKISREVYGFVHVEEYGKYKFTRFPKDIKENANNILYIDTPENVPRGSNILKTFHLLNGEQVLVAYSL